MTPDKIKEQHQCKGGMTQWCGQRADYVCDECERRMCWNHIHLYKGSVMLPPPLCDDCDAIRRTGKKPMGSYR